MCVCVCECGWCLATVKAGVVTQEGPISAVAGPQAAEDSHPQVKIHTALIHYPAAEGRESHNMGDSGAVL